MKKIKRLTGHRSPPGSAPGTLEPPPNAEPTQIHVIGYGPDRIEEHHHVSIDALAGMRTRWPVIWVNIEGFADIETLRQVSTIFSLHLLSLEDIVRVHQRPKVEVYDTYQFVVLRSMAIGERTDQMSLCLGTNFVLTFQEFNGDCFDMVRTRLRRDTSRLRGSRADYLAYALIDTVIDHYFPVLERIGERLEDIENAVFEGHSRQTMADLHALKRQLLHIRRAIWPLRQELATLSRESTPFVSDATRLYLRDCHDHAMQLMDVIESLREIANGLMDFSLSSLSHRMNEIMRVLTVISTLFMPLTFIAGVYGMNFNTERSPWNMPELNWYWGYPASLLAMLLTVVALLGFFKSKGWLQASAVKERRMRETGHADHANHAEDYAS